MKKWKAVIFTGIGTHAAGVRTFIIGETPLVILNGRGRDHVLPSHRHCRENSSPSSFSSTVTLACSLKNSLQKASASCFV